MVSKKALITDYVHPYLIKGLEQRGYQVDYDRSISLSQVHEQIAGYEGIIINSKILMNAELQDKGSRLKWIGRLGSGLEIIDQLHAARKGIAVINTPEGNRNAVAEHAVGMLLALANNLLRCDKEVRDLIWSREKNRGWELKGKTIGIIGLGHTGSMLAKKLSSWELELISYDKYKSDSSLEMPFVERVALEDILKRADIISLHLPLTAETRHLVNESFLQKCKQGAVIINTSRGAVVDVQALIAALEDGHLRGACLDVFENEKPNTYSEAETYTYRRLYACDNVILSPHVAGWTHESLLHIAEIMLEKLDSTV